MDFFLSRRLGFVVQRDHFCPEGRLQIFLALRSSGRVEIFCPEGRWVSSKSPEGQKISTLPLDRSAKKISSRPKGQKWSLWTTKPNLRDKTILVPTLGIPNLLGFLEIMKKLNCQRQTKSEKKLAKEENVPGEDAKSVQNFSQSIFLYTKARLALWGSVPLDSMFYSDFDVKLLVWFVYIRLIFLIFWLILRSHRRSKAFSPRLRVLNFLILGSETKIKSSEFLNLRLRDVD